jgi:hypothetical protein
MNTYEEVEKFYFDNITHFNSFEKEFFVTLDIPPEILKDSLKRVLVESIHPDGKKRFLLNYRSSAKDFFVYYFVMTYFFILSFPFRKKTLCKHYDIVFECGKYFDFDSNYRLLYEKLKRFNIAILSLVSNIRKDEIPILDKSNTTIYCNLISSKIYKSQFFKYFFYRSLSKKTSINFINLSLRIMRYIALYNTHAKGFSAKFLVSAGDIYYNSLRYYIYKKNSIDNIMLIQSGMKSGVYSSTSGDLYVYSDYYFGYGKHFIDNLYGKIKYKLAIGSIRLYQEVINKTISEKNDVLFIEQMAFIERKNDHSMTTYLKIVDMLIEFASKFKEYNIVYRIRPLKLSVYYNDPEKMNIINSMYARITNAGITIDDFSNTSYDAILNSKVIVYYTSALGFESLGLNKRTLCCNIDKMLNLPNEDTIGVLTEHSHELFRSKLLYLLESNNRDITNYYKKEKEKFQNIEGSPIEKITSIISEKLFEV